MYFETVEIIVFSLFLSVIGRNGFVKSVGGVERDGWRGRDLLFVIELRSPRRKPGETELEAPKLKDRKLIVLHYGRAGGSSVRLP